MDFSPAQQAALDKVAAWRDASDADHPVFRLFGFAGTGKSTLAMHFAQGAGRVLYAAYTGKAAFVLRQKGCHTATTIHSLIYIPKTKSNAKLIELQKQKAVAEAREEWSIVADLERRIKFENDNLKRPTFALNEDSELQDADLLILDEVSMVGSLIGTDLVGFKTPILALGDPGQLPPVQDKPFFDPKDPDVLLTEIHRQAADSPIIKMATEVRTRGALLGDDYGDDCHVVKRGSIDMDKAAEFDQVLVGRNATRRKYNKLYRERVLGLGTQHLPQQGDKLVCTRNNHDLGLLNGELFDVVTSEVLDDDQMLLRLRSRASGTEFETKAHSHPFEGREVPFYEASEADWFDFGYAMTVHKAQGSEWERVLLVDESAAFRHDARRWLYTGVTRASKHLTVVRQ